MYSDTTCRIKFSNGLSLPFLATRGVKQGDVLSPLLFNYYINDLVSDLDTESTDPVIMDRLRNSTLTNENQAEE